jgi:putative transposase
MPTRIVSHRIALRPTKEQEDYFRRACGTARFAYNWGLAEWKRMYEVGEKPSWASITKRLNAIKDEQLPWMREVTKLAPQHAIANLGAAFERFFNGRKKKTKRVGYPKFKKKGVSRDSFVAQKSEGNYSSVPVNGCRVRLALVGWVRMRQAVRFNGRIVLATVLRVADRWFVSLLIHTPDIKTVPAKAKRAAVGVDLGVKTLATIYDGRKFEEVEGPKPLGKLLAKLKRLSRSLTRKVKGSANRKKAADRLAKLHARIANVRSDALHKLTTRLAKGFKRVGIEDLNVSGMLANHILAQRISDMGFGEFRRQLTYKCEWYGSELIVADRFYPSSKTCPQCKAINSGLTLSDRFWVCPKCHAWHDRDRAAAENLREHAARYAASACGAEGAGRRGNPSVKPGRKEAGTHCGSSVIPSCTLAITPV